jgi:hypothetical protein
VLLHENIIFREPLPDELFQCVEGLDRADFNDDQDVTLALVTNRGVEHGVEFGLVLREAIEVNDPSKNITEFDVVNAVDKVTKQPVEDFWSLWNRIAIVEREIKPDSMKVEFRAL